MCVSTVATRGKWETWCQASVMRIETLHLNLFHPYSVMNDTCLCYTVCYDGVLRDTCRKSNSSFCNILAKLLAHSVPKYQHCPSTTSPSRQWKNIKYLLTWNISNILYISSSPCCYEVTMAMLARLCLCHSRWGQNTQLITNLHLNDDHCIFNNCWIWRLWALVNNLKFGFLSHHSHILCKESCSL